VKSLFHTITLTTNFRKPHRDRDVWGGSLGLATGVDDAVDLLEHDNGAVGSAAAVDAPALAATHHHRSMRRQKRIKESQTRGDEEAGGCSMAAVEEKRAGMQDAARRRQPGSAPPLPAPTPCCTTNPNEIHRLL